MVLSYNIMDMVVAAAVFGLILSIWLFAVMLWRIRCVRRQEKIHQRLDLTAPTAGRTRILRLWHEGKEVTTAVVDAAAPASPWARFQRFCQLADWGLSAQMVLALLAVAAMTAFGVGAILAETTIGGVTLAVAVVLIFRGYAQRRINRRHALFETQLVDALDLAARSLRAGHPLGAALGLIAEEIGPPVGTVFAKINDQQSVGVGLDEAVRQAAAASASADLKLFATAVGIQIRSGGNLAAVIDRLALVIRDRMRLNRRIRVLTAQTQFSKRILLALPFILFALLNVLNAEYMAPLYTTAQGNILLGVGAAGLLMGSWSMNRLAVMRY